jgi:Leucine-rich repeat (LRR) protein
MISDVNLAIREELDKLESSPVLHLSYKRLYIFPALIFSSPSVAKIKRLDLSHNNISVLPPSINLLMDLRELWLHFNPIKEIPSEIEGCTRLEVMDLRGTKVKELPPVVSTLKRLHELDWSETPFAEIAKERFNIDTHNLSGLRSTLSVILVRQNLEQQLEQFLLENHFARETDNKDNIPIILSFAKVLFLSSY